MMGYRIGPFLINEDDQLLFRDGKLVLNTKGKPQHFTETEWKLLLAILNSPDGISGEDLQQLAWPLVSTKDEVQLESRKQTLFTHLSNIWSKLSDNDQNQRKYLQGFPILKFIGPVERVSDIASEHGTRATAAGRKKAAPIPFVRKDAKLKAPLEWPEITEFIRRHGWDFLSMDEFIQIHRHGNWRGWTHEEVQVLENGGNYEPPEDIAQAIAEHAHEKDCNLLFGLCDFDDGQLLMDKSRGFLTLSVKSGSFHDGATLNRLANQRERNGAFTADVQRFRAKYAATWKDLPASPLWHTLSAQPLVLSRDHQIVLAKKTRRAEYAAGKWSATLEEQMLRWHRHEHLRDAGIFECVQRGIWEELGIAVELEDIRLLALGIEWGCFAAAPLFIVRARQTFDEIVEAWRWESADAYELDALDSLPFSLEAIEKALSRSKWHPSARVVRSPQAPVDLTGEWNETARARIFACFQHVKAMQ